MAQWVWMAARCQSISSIHVPPPWWCAADWITKIVNHGQGWLIFFLKPQEYITNLVFSFLLQSMRARLSHITKWNLLRKLLCWGNATSSTVHHWTWNNRMKIGRQCIDKQVSNGQLLENYIESIEKWTFSSNRYCFQVFCAVQCLFLIVWLYWEEKNPFHIYSITNTFLFL